MFVRKRPLRSVLLAAMFLVLPARGAAKSKPAAAQHFTPHGPAILWSDPADLKSRDLLNGPGGLADAPRGTFTFVKEDLDGTNPKIVVRDEHGVKWKVKLGIEARPETVASRIVWSVGYFANEDYFVSHLKVQGMPQRLHRGQNLVEPDGSLQNVRLKREPATQKKIGTWRWRQDAFTGTREWNGLRTLMAVIDNWDLKDENNAIYQAGDRRIYLVSDLGSSFGTAGRSWPPERSKGNLDSYTNARLLRRTTADRVDFASPARPRWVLAVDPKEYLKRIHLEWIGRGIPRADAEWMGGLLSRLSSRQIHDAFLAAGYTPSEADGFSRVLLRRIAELTDL